MHEQFVADLRGIVGDRGIVDPADAAGMLTDIRRNFHGDAVVIVRPASTDEVSAVVERCARDRVAIVPQGGNTGMSGGAIPDPSGSSVLLSLVRMNEIESVDPDRRAMTVQAGVTIEAAQRAAADAGLLFAADWGARGTATVGGGISTNAGGNNVARYGTMRRQILGIEAVLADGRVWNGMRALRKDSSGYDLKQLFIGAEGTLGIVTRAVLELRPATPYAQSALAALGDRRPITELYRLADRHAPGMVTAFELVPEDGLSRACAALGVERPLAPVSDLYVLVELASGEPVAERLAELLTVASNEGLVTDAVVAATSEQEQRLWALRDALSPGEIFPETQHVRVKLDSAVPIDRIGDFYDAVLDIAAEIAPDAVAYCFGHVGDGNLHMALLPESSAGIDAFLARAPELVERIDAATISFGGTLSAEHGIGRLLVRRARPQKPDVEWELMRAIKATLDPQNLMNPGALFPDD